MDFPLVRAERGPEAFRLEQVAPVPPGVWKVGEQKGAVQRLDRSHGHVELAQKLFHRQKTVLVLEGKSLGDSFLVIEGQSVILSSGPLVKVVPDEMDEFEMAL